MSFTHFLSNNNAVPITLGVLLLGAGSAFASSDAVFDAQTQVVSVDNTYIATKDLASFAPAVRIIEVTEDEENYYIEYSLSTIALRDAVWQDVTDVKQMTVAKGVLGEYDDLGVYVTEQLKQVVDREISVLTEVQEIEKRNITQKTVATAYSGLVGGLITDTTETLPGYTPVVVAPPAPPAPVEQTNSAEATTPIQVASVFGFQLIGANPARIPLNAQYSDLGVIVSKNGLIANASVETLLNGVVDDALNLDTSTSTTHTITYRVQDEDGVYSSVERTVIVGTPEVVETTENEAPEQQEATTTPEATDTEPQTEASASTTTTTTETATGETSTTEPEETIQTPTQEVSTTTPEVEEVPETTTTETTNTETTEGDSQEETTPAEEVVETAATTTATTTTQ